MTSAGDAERYRRAAEEALRQLDAAIAYLHRLRKLKLAERLAKNRDLIAKRMRRGSV